MRGFLSGALVKVGRGKGRGLRGDHTKLTMSVVLRKASSFGIRERGRH